MPPCTDRGARARRARGRPARTGRTACRGRGARRHAGPGPGRTGPPARPAEGRSGLRHRAGGCGRAARTGTGPARTGHPARGTGHPPALRAGQRARTAHRRRRAVGQWRASAARCHHAGAAGARPSAHRAGRARRRGAGARNGRTAGQSPGCAVALRARVAGRCGSPVAATCASEGRHAGRCRHAESAGAAGRGCPACPPRRAGWTHGRTGAAPAGPAG